MIDLLAIYAGHRVSRPGEPSTVGAFGKAKGVVVLAPFSDLSKVLRAMPPADFPNN